MQELPSREAIFEVATNLLASSRDISLVNVAEVLGTEISDELRCQLQQWWLTQQEYIKFPLSEDTRPDSGVPDTLYQSVKLIWESALKDARLELELNNTNKQKNYQNFSSQRLLSEDELILLRSQIQTLEESSLKSKNKISNQNTHIKKINAERAIIQSNLQTAINNCSNFEHHIAECKSDMERIIRSRDEAKKQLDVRLKAEVAHYQENVAKFQSQINYYRNQLERLRDEWGKKEVVFLRQQQDLQNQIVRYKTTQDIQRSQIKNMDCELKSHRSEIANQSLNVATSNTQALSTGNTLKRLNAYVKSYQLEVKELKKRAILDKKDIARREADLRVLLKTRNEEASEMSSLISELQRALVSRDQEIKRLTAKI